MSEAATASESREAPVDASDGSQANGHAPDKVDEAIAAVQVPNQITVDVQLPGQRAARLIVPLPLMAGDVGMIAGVLAEVYHTTQNAPTPEQMAAKAARQRLVLPR